MRKSPTRRRSTHTDLINSNDKVALLESLFLKLDSVENSLGSKLGELGKHHNGKPFPLIVGKSNIVVDVIKKEILRHTKIYLPISLLEELLYFFF